MTQDVPLILPETQPQRDGYIFAGWAENSEAEEAEYLPRDIYMGNDSTTLYAIWKNPQAGDLTGDGVISLADIVRLIRVMNGQTIKVYASPDVNGDGVNNAADVIHLLKYVSGQDVKLG